MSEKAIKFHKFLAILTTALFFFFLTWTVIFAVSCADPLVEYAKFKYPNCTVLTITEKGCGREIVFRCPGDVFEKICLSPQK